jgi:hypothetical protein
LIPLSFMILSSEYHVYCLQTGCEVRDIYLLAYQDDMPLPATSGPHSLNVKGPISRSMWVCSQDHSGSSHIYTRPSVWTPRLALKSGTSQASEHLNLFNHAISSSFRRCRVPARASLYQGLLFSLPKMCLKPHVALNEYSWYRFFTKT